MLRQILRAEVVAATAAARGGGDHGPDSIPTRLGRYPGQGDMAGLSLLMVPLLLLLLAVKTSSST